MLKIANFVIDEKFIDGQVGYQDMTSEQCQHDYFFVGKKNFNFIRSSKERIVRLEDKDVLTTLKGYDAVFLHSIFGMPLYLIPKIDSRIKVFWFAWGYDIYNHPKGKPLIYTNLFHKATKRYMRTDIRSKLISLVLYLRGIFTKNGDGVFKEAVKRVDFFSGIIPEEYGLIKENCPYFKAKQVYYAYSSVSQFHLFSDSVNRNSSGNNIIIGNSTSYTNNHLDIFKELKGVCFDNEKIFVPLSYSPNPRYVNKLNKEGRYLFGDRYVPLVNFMPIDEYNKILDSCGVGIFGFERQQGMGNIVRCLLFGAKVFLYESSIVYKHCKNLGLIVFTIEKDLQLPNALHPLSEEDAQMNRSIICKNRTKEERIKQLYAIYNIISKENE